LEGSLSAMIDGDTVGIGFPTFYPTGLMNFHRNWLKQANQFPALFKSFLMLYTYIVNNNGHAYYGKASNLINRLRADVNRAFTDHDLLIMPTTPIKASKLPGAESTLEEIAARTGDMAANTMTFNLTHHPAMSVPCGTSESLPVGMMLVGRHYDEATIYRAAYAFEQTQAKPPSP